MATAAVGATSSVFQGLAESSLQPAHPGGAGTVPLLTDDLDLQVPFPLREGRLVFLISGPEPAWLYPALHGFQQLLELPQGWDSYGAPPIVDDVIARAAEVLIGLHLSSQTPAPCIVPGSSGSIQLEWHEADADIEIHVSVEGQVSAFVSDYRTGNESDFDAFHLEARNRVGELLARAAG